MSRSLAVTQEFMFGDGEVVVELTKQQVEHLALEVTLLLCAMTSSLTLRSPSGQRVELTSGSNDVRATVYKLAATHVRFELGRNQAEWLQAVVLRAYRDQMAEVGHIHLEGQAEGKAIDLTLLFQIYKPPMSAQEASRAMDD